MKMKTPMTKRYKFLLLLLLITLTGSGFAYSNWHNKRYPSWDEEVRLSDGRVIVVHQKHEFYENYGTSQSWVTINLPELGGKQVWHSYLTPQRVDVYQGKVYVFGSPRKLRQFEHYMYPKHYMVGFVWNGQEFLRIPFLNIPDAVRQEENIYSCIPNPKVNKLELSIKDKTWCPPRGDKKQFTKKISQSDYDELAISVSKLSGGLPISD